MSAKLKASEVLSRIVAGLPGAGWIHDEDTDEMDIVLPGATGRAGFGALVKDEGVYVCLDPETFEPLSIVVQGWSIWAAKHPADPHADAHRNGNSNGSSLLRNYHDAEPHLLDALEEAMRSDDALQRLAA